MALDPKTLAGMAFIWVDHTHPHTSQEDWLLQLKLTNLRSVAPEQLTPKMKWRLEEVKFLLSQHYSGTKTPSMRLFDCSAMTGVHTGVCTKVTTTPEKIQMFYPDFCIVKEALGETLGDGRFEPILLTFRVNPKWELDSRLPFFVPVPVDWPPPSTDSFNHHDMKYPVYPGTYHIYGPSMGKYKKMTEWKVTNIASTAGMQPCILHHELSEAFDYEAMELQRCIVLEHLVQKHFFELFPEQSHPYFSINPLAQGVMCMIGPFYFGNSCFCNLTSGRPSTWNSNTHSSKVCSTSLSPLTKTGSHTLWNGTKRVPMLPKNRPRMTAE